MRTDSPYTLYKFIHDLAITCIPPGTILDSNLNRKLGVHSTGSNIYPGTPLVNLLNTYAPSMGGMLNTAFRLSNEVYSFSDDRSIFTKSVSPINFLFNEFLLTKFRHISVQQPDRYRELFNYHGDLSSPMAALDPFTSQLNPFPSIMDLYAFVSKLNDLASGCKHELYIKASVKFIANYTVATDLNVRESLVNKHSKFFKKYRTDLSSFDSGSDTLINSEELDNPFI
jgi:hypothetical protein